MTRADPYHAALRETAATTGWDDKTAVIDATVVRWAGDGVSAWHRTRIRYRLERAWALHVEIVGA